MLDHFQGQGGCAESPPDVRVTAAGAVGGGVRGGVADAALKGSGVGNGRGVEGGVDVDVEEAASECFRQAPIGAGAEALMPASALRLPASSS